MSGCSGDKGCKCYDCTPEPEALEACHCGCGAMLDPGVYVVSNEELRAPLQIILKAEGMIAGIKYLRRHRALSLKEAKELAGELARPAEERKADEHSSCDLLLNRAADVITGLTTERDALRAQIERLTSDEAVEAAADALAAKTVQGVVYLDGKALVKIAITAALRVAGKARAATEPNP